MEKTPEQKRAAKAEYLRKWRAEHPGYDKNRDRTAYNKARYNAPGAREKSVAAAIAWREANRDRHNANRRRRQKERRAADPAFLLETRVRNAINEAIRKGGYTKRARAHEILGCTWLEFKAHIERQFLRGMNWDNRDLWHLDHITPIDTASTVDDIVALNHFTNLRPLWGVDNIKKKNKITHLI